MSLFEWEQAPRAAAPPPVTAHTGLRRLAQFENLLEVRQIPTAVFRHEHHVLDADGPQAWIVEARLDGHDMAFLKQ